MNPGGVQLVVFIHQRIAARRKDILRRPPVLKISRQLAQPSLLRGGAQPGGRSQRGAEAARPVQLPGAVQKFFKGLTAFPKKHKKFVTTDSFRFAGPMPMAGIPAARIEATPLTASSTPTHSCADTPK